MAFLCQLVYRAGRKVPISGSTTTSATLRGRSSGRSSATETPADTTGVPESSNLRPDADWVDVGGADGSEIVDSGRGVLVAEIGVAMRKSGIPNTHSLPESPRPLKTTVRRYPPPSLPCAQSPPHPHSLASLRAPVLRFHLCAGEPPPPPLPPSTPPHSHFPSYRRVVRQRVRAGKTSKTGKTGTGVQNAGKGLQPGLASEDFSVHNGMRGILTQPDCGRRVGQELDAALQRLQRLQKEGDSMLRSLNLVRHPTPTKRTLLLSKQMKMVDVQYAESP
jgi:hypothetical protein